ncbi:hypothetical protein CesoFtcFv8_011453 [Champsocephalus esox]|uniref:Uncharacterized protein n=1 Tax=Champsocephalus esox TaxID=159716 RepID=A0AAN8GWR2_9TELE|nr:hypothetical protein CesoFtcFv8_011453 [Champsocephalus esox]
MCMDEGEKVLAVKTTSTLPRRKHDPTHDRFLGQKKASKQKRYHYPHLPSPPCACQQFDSIPADLPASSIPSCKDTRHKAQEVEGDMSEVNGEGALTAVIS